jgi:alginate O-acetyltransferase complex protein AlgI
MLWGMFKKVVIADRLAILVNQTYTNAHESNSTMLFIATVFFAIQIYCDFSGYSDIAIGSARCMGFNLMTNFKTPFSAVTVSEFWTRWHISLSSWFKDYLFYPLATAWRNWGKWAIISATIITFFLSGLWHGAGWNYIVYGCLTAMFIVTEILLNVKPVKIKKSKIKKRIGIIYVFLSFSFVLIFFRAKNISEAVYIIKKIFSAGWGGLETGEEVFSKFSLVLSILLIIFLFFAENKFVDKLIATPLNEKKKANLVFGIAILSMIILLGVFQKLSFIYFQF